mgnify:CR=1 FL=1
MLSKYIIVTTTTDTVDRARAMARTLIDECLAACVEIQTVQSLYRWDGAVCDTTEYVLVLKTRADLYAQVEARILALHTYDLPQIIALPIVAGLPGYLNWVNEETKSMKEQGRNAR